MRTGTALGLLTATGWLFVSGPTPALAHLELSVALQETNQEILEHPRNAELYLKRAELYRAARGWDSAMADIEQAESFSNQWQQVYLTRARLYLDIEWFASAVVAVNRYLRHEPTHTEALTIRARAHEKLGEHLVAAEDYTRAIASSPTPAPELFTERAQALMAAGGEHLDAALQGLEQGLRQLGSPVILQLAAIEVETRQNRVDAALARLDSIMARYPRKETWLARRGDILRQAGRQQESVAAYHAAWQALETLTAAHRRVPAMVELERRIRSALPEMEPARAAGSKSPK